MQPIMPQPGSAELQARVTTASAVLADFRRWTRGDLTAPGYDWQDWSQRLALDVESLLGVAAALEATPTITLTDAGNRWQAVLTGFPGSPGVRIESPLLRTRRGALHWARRHNSPLPSEPKPRIDGSIPVISEAARLAEIRALIAAFDWERDDRQAALERIEIIVFGSPR